MSKFLKILIFVFLVLSVSIGFAIFHFSNAQDDENNISLSPTPVPSSEITESLNSSSGTESSVYICPNASSMAEINPRCSGKITLKLGETIDGLTLTTTNYEGKDYYLVLGFENGGAGVNLPPIANANGPYQGYGGLPITFDATSYSSDPNNDPLQYRWDFNSNGIWDTDWLTTSIIEHIWNNDYEGIIKLEVSDGELADIATTSVNVISPRTLKQDAISELEAAKTGDKKTDQQIYKIIWFIKQSLAENLWIDASHLIFFEKGFENLNENDFEEMFEKQEWAGPRTGIVVFHFEKKSVRLMIEEIKSKKTPNELKQVFEEVINKLVKADTLLANVSLFDAKNTPVQNPKFQKIAEKQIELAEKELQKSNEELEKGRPDKAILRLAKSWLHSQLAIKFANLEKIP